MTDGQWTDYKKRFRAFLAMLRRAFASLSTVHKKTPMLRHHFLLRSVLFLITARERMKNSPHPSFEVGGAPHACIGQSHNHIKSITFKTAAAWAEWTRGFVCILAGEERSGGRISGDEDTPPPPLFFSETNSTIRPWPKNGFLHFYLSEEDKWFERSQFT